MKLRYQSSICPVSLLDGSTYCKRIAIDSDWFAVIEGESYVVVVHTPCYEHWAAKWPLCPMLTGRMNTRTVSCGYCKTKSDKEVRNKIGFIFGEK